MPRLNSFLDTFQKDHTELLRLVTAFRNTIKTSRLDKAKDILGRISKISDGHFSFEVNYLYPRLCRLVREVTEDLCRQQKIVKEFVDKSGRILKSKKINKNELAGLLEMLPVLSKFLSNCNDLVFLADKFHRDEKNDLKKRFKECQIRRCQNEGESRKSLREYPSGSTG